MNRFSYAASAVAAAAVILAGAVLLGQSGIPTVGESPRPSPSTSEPSTAAPTAAGLGSAFTAMAQMPIERAFPIVIPLQDGRLFVGGSGTRSTPEAGPPAEIFDPGATTSHRVGGNTPSGVGTGFQLRDGRLFIVAFDSNQTCTWAYLVDPRGPTSTQLPEAGSCNAPPFGVDPSLAMLADGRILLSGGEADVYEDSLLATAMVFDPSSDAFRPTGSMHEARRFHAMVTLASGQVLIAAGDQKRPSDSSSIGTYYGIPVALASAELYDPGTSTFTELPRLPAVRGDAVAIVVPGGRAFIFPRWPASSELGLGTSAATFFYPGEPAPVDAYDPGTKTFETIGTVPGPVTSATLLTDGTVLVTGERPMTNGPGYLGWSAILDPTTGAARELQAAPDRFATPAVLADGRVLFFGGYAANDPYGSRGASAAITEFK